MRLAVSIFKHSRFFLIPWILLLVAGALVLASYSKETIHLATNHYYNAFWDEAMQWITLIGDGWTVTVLVLLMFAWKRRFAFFTGIACLASSGITQGLKHTIFSGEPRPILYFAGTQKLRILTTIDNSFFDSFPSGHTTVAFAFFICLAIGAKKSWAQLACLVLALAVGFSRIYLSQHFLRDVYTGSIIGTVCSFAIIAFAFHKNWIRPVEHGLNLSEA